MVERLRRALFSAYAHGLIRFVRDADEATVAAFIDNMVRADGGWLDEERLARALHPWVGKGYFVGTNDVTFIVGADHDAAAEFAAAIAKAYGEDTEVGSSI